MSTETQESVSEALAAYASATPKEKIARRSGKKKASKKKSTKKTVASRTRTAKGEFDGVRHDPPRSRRLNQLGSGPRLVNKDPGRHYVFANPSDEVSGLDSYLFRGYEVEKHRKDGPLCANGKNRGTGLKNDEPITWRGSVCVSIDMETYREMRRYGDDAGSGLGSEHYRLMVERLKNGGAESNEAAGVYADVDEGRSGRHFQVRSDISIGGL